MERWADGRIAAALVEHDRAYDKAVGQVLGEAIAKLQDEIATLRRELATARTEVKRLQSSRNSDEPPVVAWPH